MGRADVKYALMQEIEGIRQEIDRLRSLAAMDMDDYISLAYDDPEDASDYFNDSCDLTEMADELEKTLADKVKIYA